MKPLGWIGSAKNDLLGFLDKVVREIGHALYVAQIGGKHSAAKPLLGFGGAGVLEIVEATPGIRTVQSTQSSLLQSYMFCMPFRRDPDEELQRLARR